MNLTRQIRINRLGAPLDAPFDIFKLQPDGSEQWIDNATSFNGAMFHVELAAARSPGQYVIQHRITGERKVINFGPKAHSTLRKKAASVSRRKKKPHPEDKPGWLPENAKQ